MEIGIIGLPNSGKTTVFNAITHGDVETSAVSSGKIETHLAMVSVHDPRVERLTQMFRPRKTTFASILFSDVTGLRRDASRAAAAMPASLLTQLSQSDALIHVVRAFENQGVPHPEGEVNANRDIEIMDVELILSDLDIVERRLERLEHSLKKTRNGQDEMWKTEKTLLTRISENLQNNTPIRDMELTVAEEKLLRGFQFMTAKPVLLLINAGDNGNDRSREVQAYAHQKAEIITVQGQLEAEIAQLAPEEMEEFLREYGVQESGLSKAVRLVYKLLGLISFFTVGDDEVRAWTVRKGATAVEAAGTIHSDLARGFIRAEVIGYNDLINSGSLSAARQKGLLRLEGKDYVVQDGDVLSIRFNV